MTKFTIIRKQNGGIKYHQYEDANSIQIEGMIEFCLANRDVERVIRGKNYITLVVNERTQNSVVC